MLELTYPDKVKVKVTADMLAEHKPFEVLMDLALHGILWEFHENFEKGENIFHTEMRAADLRVRPSRLFLRGECYNASTLH